MKRDKQIIHFAKGLLKASLDENGYFSEERGSAVLQTLAKNPPRRYALVLKEYLKLVKNEVAKGTAKIEYAGELTSNSIEAIESKFSEHYGRPISVVTEKNDKLIAGLRVRIGCDLYESSVAGSLKELEASLS